MKTRRPKYNNNDYEVKDRLSNLSDGVLLHILSFFDTKQAFQTFILSKRWKNLWKTLPTLTLTSGCFPYGKDLEKFDEFIVNILSLRDRSAALHSLDIFSVGNMHPQLLKRIVDYAVSYNVQQLRIAVNSSIPKVLLFRHFACENGSMDNLSSVKDVNFHVPRRIYPYENTPLILFDWLIELTNIKSLTLTLDTVEMLELVPDLSEVEFPSLYDLKSLKIVTNSYYTSIPEKVVNFLLRNAPSAKAASYKRLCDGITIFTQVLLNREWNEEHSYQGEPY